MEEDSTTGELPLHSFTATSPNLTYDTFWRSLAGTSRAVSAPRHAKTETPASSARPQSSIGADARLDRVVTPRNIHAATDAYRLQLSLSPNPRQPSVKSSPIDRTAAKSGDADGEKSVVRELIFERDVVHSPHLSSLSADPVDSVESEQNTESSLNASAVGDGSHLQNAQDRSAAPAASSSATSTKDGTLFDAHFPASKHSPPLEDVYEADGQVLLAVRCYEEWRHCLTTESADVPRTEEGKEEKRVASTDLPLSQSFVSNETFHQTSDAGELQQEREAVGGAKSAAHEQKVFDEARDFLSTSGPRQDSSAPRHSGKSKSRSTRSDATHGLTAVRAERDLHSSSSSHDTSSHLSVIADGTAGSPASSGQWRWTSPRTSASPAGRCEERKEDPALRLCSAATTGAQTASSFFPISSPFPLSPSNAVPAEAVNKSANTVTGAHAAISKTPHNTAFALLTRMERQGHTSASASPEAQPVQRKLFGGEDENEEDEERSVHTARGTSAFPTAARTHQQQQGVEKTQHSRVGPVLTPRCQTTSVPIETVIELSCSESERESERGDAEEEISTSALSGQSFEEQSRSLNQAAVTVHPSLRHRRDINVPHLRCHKPHIDMAVSQKEQSSPRDEAELCSHALYRKHHRTVAALYSAKLLDSERDNPEIQLFLCWAQEKAERRRLHWQKSKDSSVLDADSHLFDACTSTSAAVDAQSCHSAGCDDARVGVSPLVQDVYRTAYARTIAPRTHRASATAGAMGASGALKQSCDLVEPAVYVASPSTACGLAESESATESAAASIAALAQQQQQQADSVRWLTPLSAPSRFVTWIANEVDIYEELLM